MLIPHGALLLVADGKKFLLLRNGGDSRRPALVFEGGGEKENPSTKVQGTDRPGRFAGYGGSRSAMEQTDFHQLEEDRFADDIAELLEKLAEAGDFERLIVVAPARTLAELRRCFGGTLRSRIVAEIDKDLTHVTIRELPDHLTRVVAL